METLYVRCHGDAKLPEQTDKGDWMDLRSAEDIDLEPLEYRKISLGISVKLPAGYEMHIAPRSSTFEKWGIIQSNGFGVIDESYCGDSDILKIPVIALRQTHIYKGDRICQCRIVEKQPKLKITKVEFLDSPDRGGFGSTGTN